MKKYYHTSPTEKRKIWKKRIWKWIEMSAGEQRLLCAIVCLLIHTALLRFYFISSSMKGANCEIYISLSSIHIRALYRHLWCRTKKKKKKRDLGFLFPRVHHQLIYWMCRPSIFFSLTRGMNRRSHIRGKSGRRNKFVINEKRKSEGRKKGIKHVKCWGAKTAKEITHFKL